MAKEKNGGKHMNLLYAWYGVFYLLGVLNGVVATLIITKLFEIRKVKNCPAAQELIDEQKKEIMGFKRVR